MTAALVLHLEAESRSQLLWKAEEVLGVKITEPVAPPAPVSTADVAPSPAPAAVTLPTPPARATRAKKTNNDSTPAPVQPPAPTPSPAAPDANVTSATPPAPVAPAAAAGAAKEITTDEIRYALGEVNGKWGMKACTELIAQTGVDRVSMVPQDKRAGFIAACAAVKTQADADKLIAAADARAAARAFKTA